MARKLTKYTGAPDHMAFNTTKWPIPILAQPDIIGIAATHNKTAAQVFFFFVFFFLFVCLFVTFQFIYFVLTYSCRLY